MENIYYDEIEDLLELSGEQTVDGRWEVIVKYNGDLNILKEKLDVEIEILDQNYAIITIKQEQIQLLYSYIEIEYIELPKNLNYNLERELESICIVTKENSEYDLTGKGIIVAIIDSGIDYTHPDFRNEDGTSRILYLWDQTEKNGTPPKGFKSGEEYTNEQLNEALKSENPNSIIPQMDVIGHGTRVAGIACRKWKSKWRKGKRSSTRCFYYCS